MAAAPSHAGAALAPGAGRDDVQALARYLEVLARGLAAEVAHLPAAEAGDFRQACRDFQARCRDQDGDWSALLDCYRRLADRKAALLGRHAHVAAAYESMRAFWADADDQAAGRSRATFWDTYEHGRRRQLEHILARAYGAEAALLLNSGMSALAVAIGAWGLRPGARILTGQRGYFETTEYLERWVAPGGVAIERAPVEDDQAFQAAIARTAPDLVLVETVTNEPGVATPAALDRWITRHPGTLFVVDNTVQSHLTRWFDLAGPAENLVVVESGTKYLTESCMAGVLYGTGARVEQARALARATGQQMQERAFLHLCEAELDTAAARLRRHASNVRALCRALAPVAHRLGFARALDAGAAQPARGPVFRHGVGALVFLALPGSLALPGMDAADAYARHERVLARWQAQAAAAGLAVPVRAGFGWSRTAARVYGSTRLNQPDAPTYLRVSVGIEPAPVIEQLGRMLRDAIAAEVCHD